MGGPKYLEKDKEVFVVATTKIEASHGLIKDIPTVEIEL